MVILSGATCGARLSIFVYRWFHHRLRSAFPPGKLLRELKKQTGKN